MATKWDRLPSMTDDVVERYKEDLEKSRKGRAVDSSKLTGGAKEAVREAGRRAETRNLGRAGAAGAALQLGSAIGEKINEKYPEVGKAMVEKSGLGKLAEKVANNRDKVELSDDSKERAQWEDTKRVLREVDEDREASKYGKGDKYKRGGAVKSTASSRGDGIAMRGKTRGRMV